jgi:hypothetical protein
MRLLIFLFSLHFFCFSQADLQLRHINVVNVTNGKIIPDQAVSIQGNKKDAYSQVKTDSLNKATYIETYSKTKIETKLLFFVRVYR